MNVFDFTGAIQSRTRKVYNIWVFWTFLSKSEWFFILIELAFGQCPINRTILQHWAMLHRVTSINDAPSAASCMAPGVGSTLQESE